MNKTITSIGILFTLFLSACVAQESSQSDPTSLPEPEIRVVELPTATYLAPTESLPTDVPIVQERVKEMAFGMESHKAKFENHGEIIGEPGFTLMRHNGLLWDEIEAVEGALDWSAVSDLDEVLESASSSGLTTILIIRGTPEWAQLVPGSFCGPVHPDKLQNYADFIAEAVRRYSQPPFNIKYFELGNEPDVDPSLVKAKSVFGCWGDQQDAYYGGGYYAEMLKVIYPLIKNTDPEAKVLLGGLLLDCDPNQPPEGKNCNPGNFLEGVLANGGGDYFDIISFHGYTPYFGPSWGFPYELYMNEHDINWGHMGGVVDGKIKFIRQVLDKYQVDKPLFHTEGALMCAEYNPADCDPPGESFYAAQAEFAVRMYVQNWANGVEATIWYQFEGPGWRHGGLLDSDQNPKPVYEAIRFMSSMLSGTSFTGNISPMQVLKGYEFSSPEKRVWVLWSQEQVDIPYTLPDDALGIFDIYGNQIGNEEKEIMVNSPIFIELNQ